MCWGPNAFVENSVADNVSGLGNAVALLLDHLLAVHPGRVLPRHRPRLVSAPLL